jgi:hypothetical protein
VSRLRDFVCADALARDPSGRYEEAVTVGGPYDVRWSFAITSRSPKVAAKSSDRRCNRAVYLAHSVSKLARPSACSIKRRISARSSDIKAVPD